MNAHTKYVLTQVLVLLLSVSVAFPQQDMPMSQPPQQNEPTQGRPAFTQQELDQMLAPIALYPDSLLSQILMASTYPLEVVEAARWSKANPNLKGGDAVKAVEQNSWDPSVKSLVAFPQVLMMMDEKLIWMQRLGDAFLSQQAQVADTVQNLRQKAYAAGNLKSSDQVRVEQQGQTIVVESPSPQIVYVPYYDPRVVYGPWSWPAYPPVFWAPWPGYYVRPGFVAGFAWGVGISVGASFFFGAFDWPHRHVNVVTVNNFFIRNKAVRVWGHDPIHRRGVPYRDGALRQQFGRTSASPEARRDFRGFDRREFEGRREFGNRPDMRGGPGGRPEERTSAGGLGARPNTDMRGGPGSRREEPNNSGGLDTRPNTDLRGDPGRRQEGPNNSGGFRARPDRDMRGDPGGRLEERGSPGGLGARPNMGSPPGRSPVPDGIRSDMRSAPSRPNAPGGVGRPHIEQRPQAFEGMGQGGGLRNFSARGHPSHQGSAGSAPRSFGNLRGSGGTPHR